MAIKTVEKSKVIPTAWKRIQPFFVGTSAGSQLIRWINQRGLHVRIFFVDRSGMPKSVRQERGYAHNAGESPDGENKQLGLRPHDDYGVFVRVSLDGKQQDRSLLSIAATTYHELLHVRWMERSDNDDAWLAACQVKYGAVCKTGHSAADRHGRTQYHPDFRNSLGVFVSQAKLHRLQQTVKP